MASFTVQSSQKFPDGTVVGAYPRTAWPLAVGPPTGAPTGTAVSTATATGGQVLFSGLADNTLYVAYAGSPDRYLAFRTPPLAAGTGTYKGAWQPTTNYYQRDLVTNGGYLYAANAAFTSGTSFNPANWTIIGTVGTVGLARMKSQRYYAAYASTSTTTPAANNSLYVVPFSVELPTTFDRIGLEVTAAGEAGSLIRLGVYADDGTGYPGAVVLDAGTIPGDGATGTKEITINQALQPGLYWLASLFTAVTTRPTVRSNNSPLPPLGATTNASASSGLTQGILATGQATFPATFPTGLNSTNQIPRVMMRVL